MPALPYVNTTIDVYREPEDTPVEFRGDTVTYVLVQMSVPAYVSYVTGTSIDSPSLQDVPQGVRVMAELTKIYTGDRVHDNVTGRWYKVVWVLNRSNSVYPRTSFTALELET